MADRDGRFFTPPNHIRFHAKKLFDQGGQILNGSLAYLEPEGGGPQEEHTHPYDHQFVVIKGRVVIRLDGREIALGEEQAFLVDGNIPHSVWNASGETAVMLGISVTKRPRQGTCLGEEEQ